MRGECAPQIEITSGTGEGMLDFGQRRARATSREISSNAGSIVAFSVPQSWIIWIGTLSESIFISWIRLRGWMSAMFQKRMKWQGAGEEPYQPCFRLLHDRYRGSPQELCGMEKSFADSGCNTGNIGKSPSDENSLSALGHELLDAGGRGSLLLLGSVSSGGIHLTR